MQERSLPSAPKSKTCFAQFDDEDGDDPTVFMASREVPLLALVCQTPLSPRAVDIPTTASTMDDDDDPQVQ